MVEDDEKKATIQELTGPNRKNKLLSQNPDLERAQNGPTPTYSITEVDKSKEKGKKRKAATHDPDESKKRVHVLESSNVVEVVYDDSAPAPRNEEPEESQQTEQPPASDLDWLRARTSRTLGLISDDEQSDEDKNKDAKEDTESIASDDDVPEPPAPDNVVTPVTPPATDPSDTEQPTSAAAQKTKQSADEVKILRTGRLFIRNLVYGVTEDDLRAVFSPYGQIEEVTFPHFSRVNKKGNMMIK